MIRAEVHRPMICRCIDLDYRLLGGGVMTTRRLNHDIFLNPNIRLNPNIFLVFTTNICS